MRVAAGEPTAAGASVFADGLEEGEVLGRREGIAVDRLAARHAENQESGLPAATNGLGSHPLGGGKAASLEAGEEEAPCPKRALELVGRAVLAECERQ
jgi:hypothetical protein